MKKLIAASILLLLSTQIQAQWWGNSIKGNGEITQNTRNVGNYDAISVAGSFKVTLIPGEEGAVSVEAESNLQEYIETIVKNGVLKIGLVKNKNIQSSRGKDIKITVPYKDLSAVTLSGSGKITTTDVIYTSDFKVTLSGSGYIDLNIKASTTKSKVTGSGDLKLKGSTVNHDLTVTGSGDINAESFYADNVNARVTGSGDIEVRCKDTLNAHITGSGDIKYIGNPTIEESKVTGSGKITQ